MQIYKQYKQFLSDFKFFQQIKTHTFSRDKLAAIGGVFDCENLLN